MTRQQSKLKQQLDSNDDEKKFLPTISYNMKSMTIAKIKESLDNLQVKYDGKLKKQDLLNLLEKNQINSSSIKEIQQNNAENNVSDVKINPSAESKSVETKTRKYQLRSIEPADKSLNILNSDFIMNNNQPSVISTSKNKSVYSSPLLNDTELKRKRSPAVKSYDSSITRKTKRTQKASPIVNNENIIKPEQNISDIASDVIGSPKKSDISENISDIISTDLESNHQLFVQTAVQVTQLTQLLLKESIGNQNDDIGEEDEDEDEYYDVADYIMEQDQSKFGNHPDALDTTQSEEKILPADENKYEQEGLVKDWEETDTSEDIERDEAEVIDDDEEEYDRDEADEYDQDGEEAEDSYSEDQNLDGNEEDIFTDENMGEDDDSKGNDNQVPQSFMGYIASSFTNNFKPSYSQANEVVDLISSDDEEVNNAPPVSILTQPLVNDSNSIIETTAIVASEEEQSESTTKRAVDTIIPATNPSLTQNETSNEIEHVKQALTKLGNRFVTVVASNLTKEGDTCTDNKLTEEDYYLLRTYLEKNKPISIHTDVAKSSVRFTEEKSFIETVQTSASNTTVSKPNISIDTSVDDIHRNEIEIDNNLYAPTSTYIPTPAPAHMGKARVLSFNANDAAIPRPSYDGGSWTSRESFIPSIPDTPLASALGVEAFKSSSTQGKQLFENVKQNKRSIYEAGFSDVNTAHAGATPFHIDRSLDSSQASKRVSLDGYRSIISRQATPGVGVFDKFSDTPLSMGMSSMPASRIGSGEIGFSLGVPKFQVRQSYTPMFRGNSVQFSSSLTSHRIDSVTNKTVDNSIVQSSEKTNFKPTITSLNTLANSSSVNSTGVTLSYIQRRRLQREAASSQSAAMAQKILQTLTGITSPLEQQRQKPVPITWKDDITAPFNTATSTTMIDSTTIVPINKIDSNNLISKTEETKNVGWSISDTQSPFLHSSLRSKPVPQNNIQNIQETKNNITDKPIFSKVSFELPKSVSNEKSNQNQIPTLSSTTQLDQEFTFEEPIIVSGIEENETEVMRRNSGVIRKSFNTDQKIKYMFSACKSKPIQQELSVVAPVKQKSTVNNIPEKSTTISEATPSINIWAASSINDGIKCKVCMVKNKKDAIKCASCETALELKSSIASIPPATNIWAASSINDGIKCKVCMVKNKKDAVKCASCESLLDTNAVASRSSHNDFKDTSSTNNAIAPSFSFGVKSDTISSNNKTEENKLVTPSFGFAFGTSSSSSSIAPAVAPFSTGTTGFTFNTAIDANITKTLSSKPTFEGFAPTKSGSTFDTSKPLINTFGTVKEEDKRKSVDATTSQEDDDQPKHKRKTFDSESDLVTSNIVQFPLVSKPFKFNAQSSDTKSDSSNTGFVFGGISTLSNSAPPLSDNASKQFSFSQSSNVTKVEPAKISFESTTNPETKQTEILNPFLFGNVGVLSDVKPLAIEAKPLTNTSFMFGSSTKVPISTAETAMKPFSFGNSSEISTTNDLSKTKSFSSAPVVDTSKPLIFAGNNTQNDAAKLTFGSSLSAPKLSVEPTSITNPVGTQPFMFGSSSGSFPNITQSTAVTTTATTTTTTGPFSSSNIAGVSVGPFSSGNNTIGTSAFSNIASSDIFKLGTTPFGAASTSLGKPPLATANTLGSSSLMFSSSGVASVDQSNTNRTITPTPTTFGTQNTFTMDSPNSTMDIGSGGSNLSAPNTNTFTNPATAFGSTLNTNPFSTTTGNNNNSINSSNLFGTSANNSNTTFNSFPTTTATTSSTNPFGQTPMFGNIGSTNTPLFSQQSQVSSNISGPFSTINTFGQTSNTSQGFNLNNNTNLLGIPSSSSNSFNSQPPSFGNTSLGSIHSSIDSNSGNGGGGGFSLGVADNKNNANRRKILKAKRPGGV